MKCILCLLLPASLCLAAPTLDLVIVAGQSNAVGYDTSPAQLPASEVDGKIAFWFRTGDPPPDKHDSTSGGAWKTLSVQPKGDAAPRNSSARQYGNFVDEKGGFGVEYSLARILAAAAPAEQKIGVIKAAWSGTSVKQDWCVSPDGKHGPCYQALVEEVRAARAALPADGPAIRLRGFVWVQGESDANPQDGPVYAAKLGAMLTQLRKDLDAPEMPVLLGVNTRFGNTKEISPAMKQIIAEQQSLAKTLPHCAYVDTDGASLANNAHFDSAGTLEVGKRFAAALTAKLH